jgi:hypothetical protein
MYGFDAGDVLTLGDEYALYRRGAWMGMRLTGMINDRVSVGWKRAMGDNFALQGHPRFLWIDIEGAEPDNSMGERFRTVAFARASMKHIEWCALHTGRSVGAVIVLRTMLRLIGMAHFALYDDRIVWRAVVEDMKAGRPPTGAVSVQGATPPR